MHAEKIKRKQKSEKTAKIKIKTATEEQICDCFDEKLQS